MVDVKDFGIITGDFVDIDNLQLFKITPEKERFKEVKRGTK